MVEAKPRSRTDDRALPCAAHERAEPDAQRAWTIASALIYPRSTSIELISRERVTPSVGLLTWERTERKARRRLVSRRLVSEAQPSKPFTHRAQWSYLEFYR